MDRVRITVYTETAWISIHAVSVRLSISTEKQFFCSCMKGVAWATMAVSRYAKWGLLVAPSFS